MNTETYVARLYERNDLTLRQAAKRLGLNLVATLYLLAGYGIGGNLVAEDVLASVDRFA